MQAGACINITASNVNLVCSNGQIIGSGPYSGVPPFTYGIEISGASNVSVSGCSIRNFSYGIYAPSSSRLMIHDNNVSDQLPIEHIPQRARTTAASTPTCMTGSASTEGSLYLSRGASGNRVYNNTILRNQYYGVSVNSTGNTFLNNYVNSTPVSFYCSIGNGFKGSNIGSLEHVLQQHRLQLHAMQGHEHTC